MFSLLLRVYFVLFCSFFALEYFRASSEQGIEPLGNKILKALPCWSMPLVNKHDIFQIFHDSFFFTTYLPVCCKLQRFGNSIKPLSHDHTVELLINPFWYFWQLNAAFAKASLQSLCSCASKAAWKRTHKLPTLFTPTMLGVVASVSAVVCKRMERNGLLLLRLRTDGRNNSQHCCVNNGGSCCVRVDGGVQTDATTPNNVGTCSASWEGYNP